MGSVVVSVGFIAVLASSVI